MQPSEVETNHTIEKEKNRCKASCQVQVYVVECKIVNLIENSLYLLGWG